MPDTHTLTNILKSFKINAECVRYTRVRNISLYDILLSPMARVQHIEKYVSEIALALKLKSVPLIRPIPEEGIVRLEAVIEAPHKISYFDNISKINIPNNYEIPIYLGSSINDKPIIIDMAQNPHMLVSGTTGSGKSVFLHNLIAGSLRLINTDIFIVDTKQIEFKSYSIFNNIKIANDYVEAMVMLKFINGLMEYRYKTMCDDNKATFNNAVLIIDELADVILQDEEKKFTQLLCKIAQKCRSANIYIVVSTQRPSVDVLPGIIRANLPARVAFKTASHIDSKIILNEVGGEKLVGYGDAIINNYKYRYERFQATYLTANEVCEKYSNFAFSLIPKTHKIGIF